MACSQSKPARHSVTLAFNVNTCALGCSLLIEWFPRTRCHGGWFTSTEVVYGVAGTDVTVNRSTVCRRDHRWPPPRDPLTWFCVTKVSKAAAGDIVPVPGAQFEENPRYRRSRCDPGARAADDGRRGRGGVQTRGTGGRAGSGELPQWVPAPRMEHLGQDGRAGHPQAAPGATSRGSWSTGASPSGSWLGWSR